MVKESKTKSRYQQKKDKGLVPHQYDKNSKSFLAGATKWNKNEKADRQLLAMRTTKYHQFTQP